MEKRTLGSFLAALRKANGMTQRELAEKLNVSDKAVSRWERDEYAPDLTLIPIIADIFGVTSDELLRGARADRSEREDEPERTVRSDKQVDRILKSGETKYWMRSMISLGIIFVGFTMGCGLIMTKWAAWGVLIGGICLIAATICQHIFTLLAFSAVNTDEFDIEKIKRHRRNLLNILRTVVFAPAVMLEIVGILYYVSYLRFVWNSVTIGIIFFLVSILILPLLLLIWWIILRRLEKNEFCTFNTREKGRLRRKIKTWAVTAALVCVTLVGQYIFNTSTDALTFAKGTTFYNYEDFKAYMEIPAEPDDPTGFIKVVHPDGTPIEDDSDVLSNEIFDKDGNVLVSYHWKNRAVVQIEYSKNILPITTYTHYQKDQGYGMKMDINRWINRAYFAEIIGAIAIYFIIRKRRERS